MLEEKRAGGEIGSSLEAKVTIGMNSDSAFLRDFKEVLPEVFIVSAVSLEEISQESRALMFLRPPEVNARAAGITPQESERAAFIRISALNASGR